MEADSGMASLVQSTLAKAHARAQSRLKILGQDCPRCSDPAGALTRSCRLAYVDDECRHHDWKLDRDAALERVGRIRTHRLGKPSWEHPLAHSRIPPTPRHLRDEDARLHAQARQGAVSFVAERRPQGAILAGKTGCGKSFLAAWIACRFESTLWVHASRADSFVTWDPIVETLSTVSCVVFDDLGLERRSRSNYASDALASALCRAIDEGKRVVVTTNLRTDGPEGIAARYGDRARSRLTESCDVWSLGHTDLRTRSLDR